MPLKICAQSLKILPAQSIELPLLTKLLGVKIDLRHNNCLLWTLDDGERDKEKVEIVMVRLGNELQPVNAKYVGFFSDNAGAIHVFALKDSDNPLKVATVIQPAATITKKVTPTP